jgi:hypothetical protein
LVNDAARQGGIESQLTRNAIFLGGIESHLANDATRQATYLGGI